jgi:hypothetical protein
MEPGNAAVLGATDLLKCVGNVGREIGEATHPDPCAKSSQSPPSALDLGSKEQSPPLRGFACQAARSLPRCTAELGSSGRSAPRAGKFRRHPSPLSHRILCGPRAWGLPIATLTLRLQGCHFPGRVHGRLEILQGLWLPASCPFGSSVFNHDWTIVLFSLSRVP